MATLTPSDISPVAIRVCSAARSRYPGLEVDEKRIREEVAIRISGGQHYASRCGESLFIAETQDLPFSAKRASVVTFVDIARSGDGLSLWRHYRRWLSVRTGIKLSVYAPLSELPEAFMKFMARLGFEKRGSVYEYWRHA